MKKSLILLAAVLYTALLSAQNVGINTNTPQATLDVNGTVKVNSLSSGATQMVISDPSGNLSTGPLSVPILTDADGDTKVDVEPTPDADAIRFDLSGTEQMRLLSNPNGNGILDFPLNDGHIFIGQGAGAANTTTSPFAGNIFIGKEAGNSTTTGIANIFIGQKAGKSNVSGFSNVFVGWGSGEMMTSGINNTIIGNSAGNFLASGSGNTFLGDSAGNTISNANFNTLIGQAAGAYNPGSNNTFLGYQTGWFSNGSDNVFIGSQTGLNATGDNQLYIDNSDTDKPLIFGDFNSDMLSFNGHVGVGAMPNPSLGELAVIDTVNDFPDGVIYGAFMGSPGSQNDKPAIYGENAVDDFYGIGVSGLGGWTGLRGRVSANGSDAYTAVDGNATNLGTTSGAVNTGVFGKASGDNSTNYGVYGEGGWGTNSTIYAGYFSGDLAYTGTLIPPSDAKLKQNVVALDDNLEKVLQLQPKSYRYKTEAFREMNLAKGPQMGFIAQEVGAIFPDLVHQNVFVQHTDTKEEKAVKVNYVGLDYMSLIPVLTGAIQEQQQIIEDQEARIQKLEAQLQEVMSVLDK